MAQSITRSLLNRSALPLMWCAGCGNGTVLNALLCAFDELGLRGKDLLIVTGIGCWGKADDYILANALHVTHGRALAYATGAKAANPKLNVVVLMGDGDGATIGGNHLIHSARRNMDLTAIIVNNFNYGMTGGQYSGTTPFGSVTATSPWGNPEQGFDLCKLITAAGASYVARDTIAGGMRLKNRIKKGIQKKGFSLIEVLSPCTTLYGPRNNMKEPVSMLREFKKMGSMKANEVNSETEKFLCVEFADLDKPDFLASYEAARERMLEMKGGE